jgi:hypothetical protein
MKTLLRNLIFFTLGLFFANSSAYAAQWVYAQGTNAVIEYPSNTSNSYYRGWGVDFVEKANTYNWVHSSITTSGLYQARYIYVQYYKQYAGGYFNALDVYNGGSFVKRVYPSYSSSAGWNSFTVDLGTFYSFYGGLGVSMNIYPASGANTEFAIGSVAAYMQ